MTDMNDTNLRALIRMIPPVRALRDDLEQSLHLEHYAGTGSLAVRSFNGLQASLAALTNDPYIKSLAITDDPNAGDKEKVALARLAAGQLASFLEGQTGLVGVGGGGNNSIQTAPIIQNISGISDEILNKVMDIGKKSTESKDAE